MSELRAERLHKRYGARAVLAGLELTVADGSFTTVLGPSGCGKTTLLRVTAGFEAADGGTLRLDGALVDGDGRSVAPERRRVGYVPQEIALFPHLSVAGNVGFALPRRRRGARVRELLGLVGLPAHAGRAPHELSGGEQQRVALARALAGEPRLLLLDEPFSALDADLRRELRGELRAIVERLETTTVLVTHDHHEALSLSDQVAVMHGGRIAQAGAPGAVYARPVSLAVARALGDVNVLEGDRKGDVALTPLGRVGLHPGDGGAADGPVRLLVRPEEIRLRAPGGGGARGVVVRAEYHGHDTMLRVAVTGGGPVLLVRAPGDRSDRLGAAVGLGVPGPVPAVPAPDQEPLSEPVREPCVSSLHPARAGVSHAATRPS